MPIKEYPRGRNGRLGCTHTDETKKKIGNANRGRKHTIKEKLKMSLAHRGIKLSIEHRKKIGEKIRGSKNPFWKGGRFKDKDGYIYIYNPNHSYKNNQGYVFEHRLIMEKTIGRFLLPVERVHHKNEIRDDNRIENLELFDGNGSHLKYHAIINKRRLSCQ